MCFSVCVCVRVCLCLSVHVCIFGGGGGGGECQFAYVFMCCQCNPEGVKQYRSNFVSVKYRVHFDANRQNKDPSSFHFIKKSKEI